MKNIIIHKAASRGHANHGWLDTYHTFSFANYQDPERMNFGALRVLNDDTVEGGMGFGMHPHDNMEIITIPLSGDLEHKDSMGNTGVISEGDVQVMSAGTGIYHSEFNKNKDKDVSLLQIWVFPNVQNVIPRYDQKTFHREDRLNTFQQVVSPIGEENGMNIYQDAWFSIGNFENGFETDYHVKKITNAVYIFLIEGNATVEGQSLKKRDGIGISGEQTIHIKANSEAEILVMDIPMSF